MQQPKPKRDRKIAALRAQMWPQLNKHANDFEGNGLQVTIGFMVTCKSREMDYLVVSVQAYSSVRKRWHKEDFIVPKTHWKHGINSAIKTAIMDFEQKMKWRNEQFVKFGL